jgi:PKD repeat protein
VAAATATPTSGAVPLTVAFSSVGSSGPAGTTLTYNWVFGDGTSSTNANPSHIYANAGNYVVELTVADGTNTDTTTNIAVSATGLVAAFGFDETSSAVAMDAVTGVSDGTISNATHVPGKFGTALWFNGTNSAVFVTNTMVSSLSSNMTIEAWVNPTVSVSSWMPVMGKAASASQLSYVIQGSTPQNGAPAVYIAPGAGNLYGSAPLPANTWSYIVATYNGTNVCLYLNGSLVSSQGQSGAPTPSNSPLTIGSDGQLQAFWNGVIDEVRIYNEPLTAVQIQMDMTNPIDLNLIPSPQSLKAGPP